MPPVFRCVRMRHSAAHGTEGRAQQGPPFYVQSVKKRISQVQYQGSSLGAAHSPAYCSSSAQVFRASGVTVML